MAQSNIDAELIERNIPGYNPDKGARFAFAITPHASNPLATYPIRGLLVGTAGSLIAKFYGDQDNYITMASVPAGFYPGWYITHISDSSTATNMVGFYG